MNQKWLNKKDNKKLIVFFNGWGMDEKIVSHLLFEDYDVLMFNDYRILEIDNYDFSKYIDKTLLAWSMGVFICSKFYDTFKNFDRFIAINGTQKPVDDNYGIPEKIFAFTLKNIERQGIGKFNERMCANSINDFTPSRRPLDEQLEEWKTLASYFRERQKLFLQWDAVLIGEADSIFPVKNMVRFWEEKSIFVTLCPEMNHYPFCATGIKLIREALGL